MPSSGPLLSSLPFYLVNQKCTCPKAAAQHSRFWSQAALLFLPCSPFSLPDLSEQWHRPVEEGTCDGLEGQEVSCRQRGQCSKAEGGEGTFRIQTYSEPHVSRDVSTPDRAHPWARC